MILFELLVKIKLEYEKDRPTLVGGPLCTPFVFEEYHFHWGSTDHKGSEHQIDGRPYVMEMHMVHKTAETKTTKLRRAREATAASMAVVAYFFQVNNFLKQYLILRIRKNLIKGSKTQYSKIIYK